MQLRMMRKIEGCDMSWGAILLGSEPFQKSGICERDRLFQALFNLNINQSELSTKMDLEKYGGTQLLPFYFT